VSEEKVHRENAACNEQLRDAGTRANVSALSDGQFRSQRSSVSLERSVFDHRLGSLTLWTLVNLRSMTPTHFRAKSHLAQSRDNFPAASYSRELHPILSSSLLSSLVANSNKTFRFRLLLRDSDFVIGFHFRRLEEQSAPAVSRSRQRICMSIREIARAIIPSNCRAYRNAHQNRDINQSARAIVLSTRIDSEVTLACWEICARVCTHDRSIVYASADSGQQKWVNVAIREPRLSLIRVSICRSSSALFVGSERRYNEGS